MSEAVVPRSALAPRSSRSVPPDPAPPEMPRADGCNIWSPGDTDAFHLTEPADIVVDRLERAAPGTFVAFPSTWTNRENGNVVERTMFLRADRVWAVSPNLSDDDE